MPDPTQANVTVQADPKVLQGRYANAISVTSQERDVVVDFLSHVHAHGMNQAQLVARVFLNHFTAKDLIVTLQKTLEQWEKMRYEGEKPKA